MKSIGFPAAMLALLWCSTTTQADNAVITEWPVPWENTRPRDPYVAPDGTVWFCGQAGHYLARFDPRTQDFKRYDLEDQPGPHNLIIDRDGAIWYAGNLRAYIGRLDVETGAITKFAMPDARAVDPHTLVFDRNGDIWFTVQNGNFVGRLSIGSGEIRLVVVPTPGARPYGVVVDAGNHPWVALFGSNKLATVDPASMRLEEVVLPRERARPRRLAVASDGSIWYVDHAQGRLGKYDPRGKTFREWLLPGGEQSQPYAMTADDRGRIWLVETGLNPNRLVAFDPATGEFFSVDPISGGGGSVRHMYFHPPTREIWFGTDTNQIARVRVP